MSYLSYFTPQRSQGSAFNSVFGGISGIQKEDLWPSVRIAALGLRGSEGEAMGIVTMLRHLLNTCSGLRVYPAYFDVNKTHEIQYADTYLPFPELKNQLVLGGELSEDGQLLIELRGLLVKNGVFSTRFDVQDLSNAGDVIIDAANQLLSAVVSLDADSVRESTAGTDAYLTEFWDLEDCLVSGLADESLNEEQFINEAEALLDKMSDGTLGSVVLGQILSETASGLYGVSTAALRRLFDSACEKRNSAVLELFARSLIMSGRSDLVVDSLWEAVSQCSPEVKLLFVDAAVYSGHIRKAVEQLQMDVSHYQDHKFARAYADTLRYLFESGRLEPGTSFIFSQSDDIVEEIVEAYRFAYEKEAIAETGLKLLEFQLAADVDIDESIAVSILRQDVNGADCQNLISTLSDNELIESLIEAVESIEELDDTLLINLAVLYMEIDDYEAANECLQEVADKSSKYYLQTAYQVAVPGADDLIFQMSQQLAAGSDLTDEQIDVLESIIAMYDEHEAAYNTLARAYSSRGDVDAAVEVLEEAAQKIESSSFYLQKAHLLWENEQHEQAIQTLLEAAQKFQHDSDIYAVLARYLFDADQTEEAKECLRKADYLNPDSALSNQIRNYIGTSLARDG
jgi:FimV-like protein